MKHFNRKTQLLQRSIFFEFLAVGLFLALPTLTFAAPGDLDPTFGNGGKVITRGPTTNTLDHAWAMAIQSDGKIVVVGDGNTDGTWDFSVVRYNTDGSLDTSFGGTGIVITPVGSSDDRATSVAIQADGKIVVAGSSCPGVLNCDPEGSIAVVRYNPNGSLDTSFNGTGKIITPVFASNGFTGSMAIQADGKIVIVNSSFEILRYNPGGSIDTSFNGAPTVLGAFEYYSYSVAIQQDGKIVAAGTCDNPASYDFAVVRYNPNGSFDTSFGGGIVFTQNGAASEALSVKIQSDGKIVAAGNGGYNPNYNFTLVRYNPNGSLDTSFNGTGKIVTPVGGKDSSANSVVIQPDGKIIAAGVSYRTEPNGSDFAVVRYDPNGSLDTTFNGTGKIITPFGGAHDTTSTVAIQGDGKIVVAGSTDDLGDGSYDFALVRYQTSSTVDGRVLTPDGRGLRNARVSITDPQGVVRTTTTSSFGFYSFDGVVANAQYTISVRSRLYRYTSQTVLVRDNLTLQDFVGLE